jgi:hypothetical protein
VCTSCRALMALGITGPFETWKEGIPYACLRGDIEKVAGLTVHEPDDGVVHFARWRPFNQVAVSRSAVPSPAREEDAAARDGAGDTNASPRSDRESIPVEPDDPFTARMFEALNAMMLDMLAAIARKDTMTTAVAVKCKGLPRLNRRQISWPARG